jgi:Sulfotransferase family
MRAVFVGGCERSGTTMLGAMLGAHSQCISTPETQFIEHQFQRDGFDPNDLNPRETLASILSDRRYRLLWQQPIEPASIDPSELGSTYPQLLSWLIRHYGRSRGKASADVWVDHTPTNFRRSLTLLALFPAARFLHLIRDGRAVAASLLPLDWGPNNALHAAEFWMARCAVGLAAESTLGRERVLRVRYEDLITAPESTLRRIAEFVGLEYQSAMTSGAGGEPGRYHEHQHRLVGHPPDRSRVAGWRQSLTARQIEIFEAEAGEFLTTLGYEPVYGIRARPASQVEVFRMRLLDLSRRAANNIRRQRRARQSLS